MPSVAVEAFAKVNLTLNVLGRRADGFHDVCTVLQTIDLRDRITCWHRPGPFRLRCAGADVPADRTNLVWRAAEALWSAAGRVGPVRDVSMAVTKRIPVSAGLGGGSSDAAATLVALARLWKLDVSRRMLVGVAATLGADVPFFLTGGTALGVGRGDEVYPLIDLPRWWVVIVRPPFGVSTADAYGWCDAEPRRSLGGGGTEPGRGAEPHERLDCTWLGGLPVVRNDLESPVARRHPEIVETIAALRRHGAMLAAMSGSGSAVFGVFATAAAAREARRRMRFAPGSGWKTWVARFVPKARNRQ